jgi:hypothetical protein
MRAAAANRILWWIVGVMGISALLAIARGDPEGRELFGGFLFIAVVVGGVSWLSQRYRVGPRRASFEDQARHAGLRAEAGDPFRLLDRPFALFGRAASVRDIENTASGIRGGERVAVVDYWYAPSSDPQLDDYRRYTCILKETPTWWMDMSVLPRGLVELVRSVLPLGDLETESEAFNRRYEVRAADRQFAYALLDQRMMAWLLEQPVELGFEVVAGSLMVVRRRAGSSLDDVGKALELADRFEQHVPSVVRAGPI